MKRIFSVLLLFFLLVANASLIVAEEAEQPQISALSLIPSNYIVAAEARVTDLDLLMQSKVLNAFIDLNKQFINRSYSDSMLLKVLQKMEPLQISGPVAAAILSSGRRVAFVLSAKVKGNVNEVLSNALKNSPWRIASKTEDDFTWWEPKGGRNRFKMLTFGEFVLIASHEEALRMCLDVHKGLETTVAENPVWGNCGELSASTVARGVLDFEYIVKADANVPVAFRFLGAPDPEYVSFRLEINNGALSEKINFESLTPFTGIARMLSGAGSISEDDSIIPDTALLSIRSKVDLYAVQSLFETVMGFAGARFNLETEVCGILGIQNIEDLLTAFSGKLEGFFDYPEGCLLPDFVVALDCNDPAAVKKMLESMSDNVSFDKAVIDNTEFFALSPSDLEHDFPWGVAFGVYGSKLLMVSNAEAALAAIERAKTNKLVDSSAYKEAMSGKPVKRGMSIYLDKKVPSYLAGFFRAAMPRLQRAFMPSASVSNAVENTAIVVSGGEKNLEIASSGTGVLLSTIAISAGTVFVYDSLARTGLERVVRSNLYNLRSTMTAYFEENGFFPPSLFDLKDFRNFELSLLLNWDAEIPKGGITEDFLNENAAYYYIPGLDKNNEAELKLPLLIYKKPLPKYFLCVTAGGYVQNLTINRLRIMLKEVNEVLGTDYTLEDGEIKGF